MNESRYSAGSGSHRASAPRIWSAPSPLKKSVGLNWEIYIATCNDLATSRQPGGRPPTGSVRRQTSPTGPVIFAGRLSFDGLRGVQSALSSLVPRATRHDKRRRRRAHSWTLLINRLTVLLSITIQTNDRRLIDTSNNVCASSLPGLLTDHVCSSHAHTTHLSPQKNRTKNYVQSSLTDSYIFGLHGQYSLLLWASE